MMNLHGCHFLVTRPSPAGDILCERIKQYGGMATHIPTLAYAAIQDQAALIEAIKKIGEQDWLIFMSPQAVRESVPFICREWPILPEKVKLAAVGGGTEQALKDAGYHVAACPTEEWSSEGLLALPVFKKVDHQAIALIRGEGGREVLTTVLEERGAVVTQIICYKRILPTIDSLENSFKLFQQEPLDVIICGSFEATQNLKSMFGEEGWAYIQAVPLIVMSERVKMLAQELGFQTILVSPNANNETVLNTFADYFQ